MENFELILIILDAVGSISAAIGIIVSLVKFSKRLRIIGEFPIRKTDTFLITVYNNTLYDNEIKSICFCKGNAKNLFNESSIFYCVDFNDFNLTLNPNTECAIVPKGSFIEIPVLCKCIACNYNIIGESIGKPYDKIHVLIYDKNGHSYSLNTHRNVDYFRRVCN
ncbi:MAG: hypothetical protein IKB93_00120 [Clostridia bacterium]|nr:hypothetical protein [Clostridia bacterium]